MQYTVRNVPEALDKMLRQRAADQRKSLNEVVLDALMRSLGVAAEPVKQRDLGELAGTWVDDTETDAALAEQRSVDEELWR